MLGLHCCAWAFPSYGVTLQLQCTGFPVQWLLLSTGSRAHRLNCPVAWGSFWTGDQIHVPCIGRTLNQRPPGKSTMFLLNFFFGCAPQPIGSQFPTQGSNPCPLHWKHRALKTGLPGTFLKLTLIYLSRNIMQGINSIMYSLFISTFLQEYQFSGASTDLPISTMICGLDIHHTCRIRGNVGEGAGIGRNNNNILLECQGI